MCRVTIGHLRVTVGHPWVTIGHHRATMGHLRLTIGYLKATVVHIRVTLGHLKVTIGNFFSELHPKVRPTCHYLQLPVMSRYDLIDRVKFVCLVIPGVSDPWAQHSCQNLSRCFCFRAAQRRAKLTFDSLL